MTVDEKALVDEMDDQPGMCLHGRWGRCVIRAVHGQQLCKACSLRGPVCQCGCYNCDDAEDMPELVSDLHVTDPYRSVRQLTEDLQEQVALSSGEAEFYAIGRGAASALMMKYFLEQVGIEVVAVIQSDSSAARGIASRIGCGKLRHLHIRDLWIQEKVRSAELVLERALTEDNTSDLGTKHIDGRRIEKLVGLAGMRFQGSVAGQAGLKGLAVAILLLGRAAATTAMEVRKEERRRHGAGQLHELVPPGVGRLHLRSLLHLVGVAQLLVLVQGTLCTAGA